MITSPAVTRNVANRGLSRAWLAISVFALMTFTGAGVEANNSTVGDVHLYGDELRPLIRGLETMIRAPDGSMVALIGEEARYLLVDHLDSARATVGSGLVHHEYAPYGTAVPAGAGSRYAGHPYDGRRALFETHSRAYDASAGRFLSADPLRANASPYVYVANNPILFNDPTGAIRTGTVVTPEVLKLSRELVGEISQFESLSRFLWIEMEPAVSDFFLRLARFYYRDKPTYFSFKIMAEHPMSNEHVLRKTFEELMAKDSGFPRLKMREMHLVASNLGEYHRLMGREDAYYAQEEARVSAMGGSEEKHYRSPQAMELLRDTTGSIPGKETGYATCDEAAG